MTVAYRTLPETPVDERLERVWEAPRGFAVLKEINNTSIGFYYIVTGLFFFLAAGVMALLMRIQLAVPGNTFLSAEVYNQVFTMHGTVMMFLFAVPIMEGIAVYLVPLMLGARDLPFPRLSAYGYWCYLLGGLIVLSSLFFGVAPDSGWFMYPPLSSQPWSPGLGSDFWLLGLAFIEISAISAAIELVVGILKMRAPGMSINRMPLFAWYILVTAFMIIFGFPPLLLADLLLELERTAGLPFFDPARGGDALLWQHLFWLFGHPEVYIIFLPAVGIVTMVLPTFARVPFFGYGLAVLSAVSIGFFSFGLWVHHMYATGLPQLSLNFFSGASVAIAVPNGIQIFAIIATLLNGRPVLRVPMLFVLGFIFIFVLGGLTGVMVAIVPYDWQVHDTYFVVAHLHYVLIGGAVFPVFAGLYYWLPLHSGRLASETLGRWAFGLMFVGFNLAFFPMHLTGLIGMTRRIYTYPEGLGWSALNMASTIGAFIFAAGVAVTIFDVFRHYRAGRRAGHNPWNAGTLEWWGPTPQIPMGTRSVPVVTSPYPLWDQPSLAEDIQRGRFFLAAAPVGQRETLRTSVIEARPEQIIRLPHPTWVPLLAAVATAVVFLFLIFQAYVVSAVAAGVVLVLLWLWLWRTEEQPAGATGPAGMGFDLPVGDSGPSSHSWWGVALLLLVDASMFGSLVFGYYFLWTTQPDNWPPAEFGDIGLWPAAIAALLLVAGSAAVHWGDTGIRRDRRLRLAGGMILGALLAPAAAVALILTAWLPAIDARAHSYGAVVWTLIGYQIVHLAICLLMAAFVLARLGAGRMAAGRAAAARNSALFWHYTTGQGLVVLAVVALSPLAV